MEGKQPQEVEKKSVVTALLEKRKTHDQELLKEGGAVPQELI